MKTSSPWYRQMWPWLLMLPPAVALMGGLATLWLAVEHADSVVPDRLSRVGVAVQPDYVAGATGAELTTNQATGRVHLRVEDERASRPLSLRWLHPTLPERDRISVLQPMGAGEYEAPFPAGLNEARSLRLESAAGWVLEGRWVPGSASTRLVPLVSRAG
ncbi:MAG: hypothetical protein AMXMBFR76_08940 [Pseudomonadota bacterium]|jgi:hypothetical protein